MSALREKIIEFIVKQKDRAKQMMLIGLAVMGLTFAFLTIVPQAFGIPILIFQLLIFASEVLLYKAYSDDTSFNGKRLLKISMVLYITFMVSTPIRALLYKISNKALTGAWLMLTAMGVILGVVLVNSDSVKKLLENTEGGLLSKINGSNDPKPGDIVLCNVKEKVAAGEKDPREIWPAKDRFLHMLIIGPTGCGKTSQTIIPMILQDIQNPEWGITVLEPKGDLAIKAHLMAERFGRKSIYFDPSYKNCPKFNPLSGREVDVVENIATTFKMLDPDSPQFFKDLNEQLTRNAIKVLKRLDKSEGVDGKYATLIWLNRLLQNSGGQGRELVNSFSKIIADSESEAAENKDIAQWFLNDYFPERSKVYENTSGVRSQVAKLVSNQYLRETFNPDFEKGERNEINFDEHLASGDIICISTAQGVLRGLSAYLGYFIILTLQSSVFRRPGTENTRRPHSLYIDEFQTYSTPGFSDMLTQGRSYRVSSILATQARAQMAMGGGRDGKNFVELVSANARNLILYPGLSPDDAEYYSKQFGEYEKTDVIISESHKRFNLLTGGLDRLGHPTEQIREQKKMEANFSPTDLIYGNEKGKSFGEIAYCIIKNNSVQPAKIGLISYIPKDLNDELDAKILAYNDEYMRESAVEASKHKEETEKQEKSKISMPDDKGAANEPVQENTTDKTAPLDFDAGNTLDGGGSVSDIGLNFPSDLLDDTEKAEAEGVSGDGVDLSDVPDVEINFDDKNEGFQEEPLEGTLADLEIEQDDLI